MRQKTILLVWGVVVTALASIASGQTQPEVYGCEMTIYTWNADRKVTGAVNTECGPIHSVPWGNWGVDSNFQGRMDGHQFDGWKVLSGSSWHQWNSCTWEYQAPDCWHYNGDACMTQQTTRGDNLFGQTWNGYWADYTCDALIGQVVSVNGLYMELWEIDPHWNDDEHVATLDYPTVYLTMTNCDQMGCSDKGDYFEPTSVNPNVATAKVAISQEARYNRIY
jgi:hypothetical protein